MRSLSLSHRLFLLIAVALFPVTTVLFWNLHALRNAEEREAHDVAFRSGQVTSLELQRTIAGLENLLFAITAAPSVAEQNVDKCTVFLARLAARLPGIASIGVVAPDGTLRCRQDGRGLGTDFSDRPYFQEALKSKELVIGEYTKGRITGQAVLPLALSSWDESGEPRDVAVLALDLGWLQKQVEQREFPPGSSLTVGDHNGTILARYPLPERFVGTKIPHQYMSLINGPKPGTIELTSQDGTRRLLAYFPVSVLPKGLYVSAGISTDEQYFALRAAAFTGLFAAVIALLLSLLLYWHTSRRAIRKQSVLARELDHRVKNMLAVVRMIARQTFRKGTVPDEMTKAFDQRLNVMAGSYDMLRNDSWRSATLLEIVEVAAQPFISPDEPRLDLEGPELLVGSRTALMMGMALHELFTNATKYGALSRPGGKITLRWRIEGDPAQFTFEWIESGAPSVVPPASTGFGSTLIKRALASQLAADVEMDFQSGGLVCRITAAASRLADDVTEPPEAL